MGRKRAGREGKSNKAHTNRKKTKMELEEDETVRTMRMELIERHGVLQSRPKRLMAAKPSSPFCTCCRVISSRDP